MKRLLPRHGVSAVPGGPGFVGPPTAGYFYNYESTVEPRLTPGTQQFNTLDRMENYWQLDQSYDMSEWILQEDAGIMAQLNLPPRQYRRLRSL